MEKKSKGVEVYKVRKEDYSEWYKELTKTLGDENPFAKFSIGSGFYVWSDDRCQWHCMVNASESEKSAINEAFLKLKEKIGKKIAEKTVEVLFTTPDDSYIYYNADGGEIKILITGWGFRKPKRTDGKGDEDDFLKKNPVTISFTYNGEVLTNYEFGLILPKQVKHFKTDHTGIFKKPDSKVGDKFVLTDFKSQKEFSFEVVEGKSSYVFDVTRYARLDVEATCDGTPFASEKVVVEYRGDEHEATTDENGHAEFTFPFYEGESVAATMREIKKTANLEEEGTKVEFSFDVPDIPKVEEPEKESGVVEIPDIPNLSDVRVMVTKDGEPVASQPVTVAYGDKTLNGMTDAEGIFTAQVEVKPDQMCNVSTPGYESQSKQLDPDGTNEFLFEAQSDLPELPNDIKVMLRDFMGKPIVCNNVIFRQQNKPELTVALDENGDTTFPEGRFDIGTPISVQINGWQEQETGKLDPLTFSLEKDEYEYLLQEQKVEKAGWLIILLEILAVILAVVALAAMWPYFVEICGKISNLIYR